MRNGIDWGIAGKCLRSVEEYFMPYKNVEQRKIACRRRYAERKANGTLVGYTPIRGVRHAAYMARIREEKGYWESRKYILKHRYGLSIEAFFALLESQGSKCAICSLPLNLEAGHQKTSEGLTIDHDHATGHVRGLLHRLCNSWLAPLEHNGGTWLKNALAYLEVPKSETA
jgi:Recombination endonuclease VII